MNFLTVLCSSSFQMTVQRNYAIVIATCSDRLKNFAPVFQQAGEKQTKTVHILCARTFSSALSKWQETARKFDWFIALFAPVVIGQSKYFGIEFSIVIWNPLRKSKWKKKWEGSFRWNWQSLSRQQELNLNSSLSQRKFVKLDGPFSTVKSLGIFIDENTN